MVLVWSLPHGWSLWADPATCEPWMRHKDGRRRQPWEVAQLPDSWEARDIYRAMKRNLDVMDNTMKLPGEYIKFRCADMATFNFERVLRRMGRWSDDLKDTGIEWEVPR